MSAFLLLNVEESADDAQIKEAYLSAVRQYPPDHYPERYEQIRAAYEAIATERDRLKYLLFNSRTLDPLQAMALFLTKAKAAPQFSKECFHRVLAQNDRRTT